VLFRSWLVNAGNTFFGPNFELYIGDGVNKPGTLCGYGASDISTTYNIQCFGGVMVGQTLTIQNRYGGGVKLCDVKLFGAYLLLLFHTTS